MIAELQRARRRWGPCGLLCEALGHSLVIGEDYEVSERDKRVDL